MIRTTPNGTDYELTLSAQNDVNTWNIAWHDVDISMEEAISTMRPLTQQSMSKSSVGLTTRITYNGNGTPQYQLEFIQANQVRH
jgi:hypothetical protein